MGLGTDFGFIRPATVRLLALALPDSGAVSMGLTPIFGRLGLLANEGFATTTDVLAVRLIP